MDQVQWRTDNIEFSIKFNTWIEVLAKGPDQTGSGGQDFFGNYTRAFFGAKKVEIMYPRFYTQVHNKKPSALAHRKQSKIEFVQTALAAQF